MTQRFPVSAPDIHIFVRVGGDCTIRGSEEQWIETGGDSEGANLFIDETQARVTSAGDCSIIVPEGAQVQIEKVGGDAEISRLTGYLTIDVISGDFSGEDLGTLKLEKLGGDGEIHTVAGDISIGRVGGDLDISRVGGQFRMRKCGGDFSLTDVAGAVYFETVGGDASLVDISGGVQGSVGGDASLKMRPGDQPGRENVLVNSGGDIDCVLPAPLNASIRLGSSGRRIRIVTGEHEQNLRAMVYQLKIGSGETQIALNAGGDIDLTLPDGELRGSATTWGYPNRADRNQLKEEIRHSVEQSLRGAMMSQEMSAQIEQKTRQAAERARQRIEQALQHLDFPPVPPQPVAPEAWMNEPIVTPPPPPDAPQEEAADQTAREPVTDEERLMVLRMVQEKKITIEQAEQLLEALDAQEQ
ncbi:MAG TPA: hypothetical protein VHO48_04015 [Anaerolineaceae bacterium]|nr:hypothetical protein [Anaerolineaceae bacterium]